MRNISGDGLWTAQIIGSLKIKCKVKTKYTLNFQLLMQSVGKKNLHYFSYQVLSIVQQLLELSYGLILNLKKNYSQNFKSIYQFGLTPVLVELIFVAKVGQQAKCSDNLLSSNTIVQRKIT